MLNLYKLRGMLLLLSCTALLSACLPEDKDPNATAEATGAGKETGGYYGAALGNVAMQIQNAVVSSADWFENVSTGQTLDLAAMGIEQQNLPADIKSHICPTGAGSEVMQLTWLDGRNDAGQFSLKGIGEDSSALLSALRSRVSPEQLGTFAGQNTLALANNETTAIPSSCANLDIPAGAPVIAFRISRPAAPTTTLSRTEYRSVECGTDVGGADQSGARVEKRVVTYNSDGSISPTDPEIGWSTEDMGECITSVNIVADMSNAAQTSGANMQDFAAIGLRSILQAQIAQMDCKSFTINETNKDNTQKLIDTCGNGQTVTGKGLVEETAPSLDDDQKTLSCNSTTNPTVGSPFGNVTGSSTVSSLVWSGDADLIRDRKAVTVGEKAGQVQVAKWIGKPNAVRCDSAHNITYGCQQIGGAKVLSPRADASQKFINTAIPVDRSPMTVTSAHYVNGNTVLFKGDEANSWGNNNDCGGAIDAIGADCLYSSWIYVKYFNTNWLNAVTAPVTTGVQGLRTQQARTWENPNIFKPKITQDSGWDLTNIGCEWSVRTALPPISCPDLMYPPALGGNTPEPRQGGYAPAMDLNDPAPKTITGLGMYPPQFAAEYRSNGTSPQSLLGVRQIAVTNHIYNSVANMYAALNAAGNYVTQISRPYERFNECRWWTTFPPVCALWGGSYSMYGNVVAGPGPDAEYLMGWNKNGRQITLLNTDGIGRSSVAVESPTNTAKVIDPASGAYPTYAGYTEPVRCGEGWYSSFTRPAQYYVYWQDCSGKGGCTSGYNGPYNTSVTVYTTNVREWRSNAGWSNTVTRYTWSSPGGSGTVYNANQVPSSFVWYQ